jgi:hypothetical protein
MENSGNFLELKWWLLCHRLLKRARQLAVWKQQILMADLETAFENRYAVLERVK